MTLACEITRDPFFFFVNIEFLSIQYTVVQWEPTCTNYHPEQQRKEKLIQQSTLFPPEILTGETKNCLPNFKSIIVIVFKKFTIEMELVHVKLSHLSTRSCPRVLHPFHRDLSRTQQQFPFAMMTGEHTMYSIMSINMRSTISLLYKMQTLYAKSLHHTSHQYRINTISTSIYHHQSNFISIKNTLISIPTYLWHY